MSRRTACHEQRGYALLELLVAAVLTMLVLSGAFGLVASHERAARGARERIARLDALRLPELLLRQELRTLAPEDFHAVARDSIAARLFRGFARACARVGSDVVYAYAGMRDADPAKDSVLVVSAGGEHAARLLAIAPAPPASCSAEGALLTIRLEAEPPPDALLLVFESGTYYLSDAALRFRRGAEGRQPLTAEHLDTRYSHFDRTPAAGPDAVSKLAAGERDRVAGALRVVLRAAGASRVRSARVRLPNLPGTLP